MLNHICLIEFLFEIVIAVFAFISHTSSHYVYPQTILILQLIGFGVCFLCWILCYYWTAPTDVTENTPKQRLAWLFKIQSIYLIIAAFIHLKGAISWIIWLSEFGDLSRPTFTVNVGARVIHYGILSAHLSDFMILLFFLLYEYRDRDLRRRIEK